MAQLTNDLHDQYRRDGYLFFPSCFCEGEVDVLTAALPSLLEQPSDARVLEEHGRAVRAVHGFHLRDGIFATLPRHPRLLMLAMAVLRGSVYVHQTKLNVKEACEGEVWPWHQDSIFWLQEDGLPSDDAVNVLIFLDEVTEFNGPLMVIPGSHNKIFDVGRNAPPTEGAEDWEADLAAHLSYTVKPDTVRELVDRSEIVAPKGPAGSVLMFHPTLVHGSAQNMSPDRRAVAMVTFNHVDNAPSEESQRPEFLAGTDLEALTPVNDDVLLRAGSEMGQAGD